MSADRPTFVCLASYEKGHAFMNEAAAQGCNVLLLTAHTLRDAAWPWASILNVQTFPDQASPVEVLALVQRLARTWHVDRVVALDEFDLEAAALIREEFRLPGMGQSTTRHFRDKLAMRTRVRQAGIPVPDFTATYNDDDLRTFLAGTKGPWLLKPRTSASAIGIRRVQHGADLWRTLDELGDERPNFLLECFIPGDVFHVDSVSWNREVLLQAAHAYGAPPMALMQDGGVFTTRTLASDSDLTHALRSLDADVLTALGMVSGVTHSEYIRASNGILYFLESAARVGGAYIAELVEFSTGINPWREWARIEAAMAYHRDFRLSPTLQAYAGSVICLAKQEHPDLTSFNDPEVVFRIPRMHHAGLIVRSTSADRVEALVNSYRERFSRDFCTSMPPPERPTA